MPSQISQLNTWPWRHKAARGMQLSRAVVCVTREDNVRYTDMQKHLEVARSLCRYVCTVLVYIQNWSVYAHVYRVFPTLSTNL